jgi:lipoate-protein ligase A
MTERREPPAHGGPTECRLLVDPPGDGAWNMAVDEWLLEWSARHGQCAWRFYQWQAPTLSLGYFQNYDDRQQHTASLACAVVRRLTGGGAILHDQELTYSLAVPAAHPLAAHRDGLYRAIHDILIAGLTEFGISAALCGPSPPPESAEPFLCFQRRTAGDVLLDNAKIAGSAQRRRRGAVLQHGSLLLKCSSYAAELPGLAELSGMAFDVDQLQQQLSARIATRLALRWRPEPLEPAERAEVDRLRRDRYIDQDWTQHRGRVSRTSVSGE